MQTRFSYILKAVAWNLTVVFTWTQVALAAPSDSFFSRKRPDHRSSQEQQMKLLHGKRQLQAGRYVERATDQATQRRASQAAKAFLLPNLADLSDLYIPEDFGHVLEVYDPPDVAPDERRLVIHVQDLHTQPEAQQQLVQLIQHLRRHYDLPVVCAEGAGGLLRTETLAQFPDANVRQTVAQQFLEAGELTGEEFLAITSDTKLPIEGIEDANTYWPNLVAFHEAMAGHDASQLLVDQLRAALDALKPELWNRDILRLDQQHEAYGVGRVSPRDYVSLLMEYADGAGIDLSTLAPQVARFQRLLALETQLDEQAVQPQTQQLLRQLSTTLGRDEAPSELDAVLAAARAMEQGRLGSTSFYRRLAAVADGTLPTWRGTYPQLAAFLEYIDATRQLDQVALYQELDALYMTLQQRLARRSSARELVNVIQRVDILDGLINLRVSNEQFDSYREHRTEYTVASFKRFVWPQLRRHGLNRYIDFSSVALDERLSVLERFYEVVKARDDSMVRNTFRVMDQYDARFTLLVAGGFHTRGITQRLRDSGYSYLVVAPSSDGELDYHRYHALLSGKTSPLPELLSNGVDEGLRVTQGTAPADWMAGGERMLEAAAGAVSAEVRPTVETVGRSLSLRWVGLVTAVVLGALLVSDIPVSDLVQWGQQALGQELLITEHLDSFEVTTGTSHFLVSDTVTDLTADQSSPLSAPELSSVAAAAIAPAGSADGLLQQRAASALGAVIRPTDVESAASRWIDGGAWGAITLLGLASLGLLLLKNFLEIGTEDVDTIVLGNVLDLVGGIEGSADAETQSTLAAGFLGLSRMRVGQWKMPQRIHVLRLVAVLMGIAASFFMLDGVLDALALMLEPMFDALHALDAPSALDPPSVATLGEGGAPSVTGALAPAVAPLLRWLNHIPKLLPFGTSGLRGKAKDMTDLVVYYTTRGFLNDALGRNEIRRGDRISIGGDRRPSTPRIARAVARAVRDAGLVVDWQGTVTTPALALWAQEHGQAAIMVTGSHIPFDENGIKFYMPGREVLKSDEAAVLGAVDVARSAELSKNGWRTLFWRNGNFKWFRRPRLPALKESPAQAFYLQENLRVFGANPRDPLRGKKVVVFEQSSVGRDDLKNTFQGLGAHVIGVGRSETFIPIDTENITPEMLEMIEGLVPETHRDAFAIVFEDADGDRPALMYFDEGGTLRFLRGDMLGAVTERYVKEQNPGQRMFVSVTNSASDALEGVLEEAGIAEVERTPIGSPYTLEEMIQALKPERGFDIAVAHEVNGGTMFGSPVQLYGQTLKKLATRDAIRPLVIALFAAAEKDQSVEAMVDNLPPRFTDAGKLKNFPRVTANAIIEQYRPEDPHLKQADIEGDTIVLHYKDFDYRNPDAGYRKWTKTIDQSDARFEEVMRIREQLTRYLPVEEFGEIVRFNWVDALKVTFASGDLAIGDVIYPRASGNSDEFRAYSQTSRSRRHAAELKDLVVGDPDGILRRMEADMPSEPSTATATAAGMSVRVEQVVEPVRAIGATWRSPQAAVASEQFVAAARAAIALHRSDLLGSGAQLSGEPLSARKKAVDAVATRPLRDAAGASQQFIRVAVGEGQAVKAEYRDEGTSPGMYHGETYGQGDPDGPVVLMAVDSVDGTTSAVKGSAVIPEAPTVLVGVGGLRAAPEGEGFAVMGPAAASVAATTLWDGQQFRAETVESYLRVVAQALGKRLDQLRVVIHQESNSEALLAIARRLGVQTVEPAAMLEELYVIPSIVELPGATGGAVDVLMSAGLGSAEITMVFNTIAALGRDHVTLRYTLDGQDELTMDDVVDSAVPPFQVIVAVRQADELGLEGPSSSADGASAHGLLVADDGAVYRISIDFDGDAMTAVTQPEEGAALWAQLQKDSPAQSSRWFPANLGRAELAGLTMVTFGVVLAVLSVVLAAPVATLPVFYLINIGVGLGGLALTSLGLVMLGRAQQSTAGRVVLYAMAGVTALFAATWFAGIVGLALPEAFDFLPGIGTVESLQSTGVVSDFALDATSGEALSELAAGGLWFMRMWDADAARREGADAYSLIDARLERAELAVADEGIPERMAVNAALKFAARGLELIDVPEDVKSPPRQAAARAWAEHWRRAARDARPLSPVRAAILDGLADRHEALARGESQVDALIAPAEEAPAVNPAAARRRRMLQNVNRQAASVRQALAEVDPDFAELAEDVVHASGHSVIGRDDADLPNLEVVVHAESLRQPLRLYMGDVLLNQVLRHLIDNALISMHGRKVQRLTITLSREEDFDVLRVSDTGRGIPPARQETIWDAGETDRPEGTAEGHGAGLVNVRQWVDEVAAEISLESSVVGSGTTFAIRFPTGVLRESAALLAAGQSAEAQEIRAQASAVRGLGSMARNEAVDTLGALGTDVDGTHWQVRWSAAWSLGQLTAPDATAYLSSMLEDPSWVVRMAAARSLGNRAPPGESGEPVGTAVNRLRAALEQEQVEGQSTEVETALVEALGSHTAASPEARDLAVAVSRDQRYDRRVRQAAVFALGAVDDLVAQDALTTLMRTFDGQAPLLRLTAAWAIGEVVTPERREHIRHQLEETGVDDPLIEQVLRWHLLKSTDDVDLAAPPTGGFVDGAVDLPRAAQRLWRPPVEAEAAFQHELSSAMTARHIREVPVEEKIDAIKATWGNVPDLQGSWLTTGAVAQAFATVIDEWPPGNPYTQETAWDQLRAQLGCTACVVYSTKSGFARDPLLLVHEVQLPETLATAQAVTAKGLFPPKYFFKSIALSTQPAQFVVQLLEHLERPDVGAALGYVGTNLVEGESGARSVTLGPFHYALEHRIPVDDDSIELSRDDVTSEQYTELGQALARFHNQTGAFVSRDDLALKQELLVIDLTGEQWEEYGAAMATVSLTDPEELHPDSNRAERAFLEMWDTLRVEVEGSAQRLPNSLYQELPWALIHSDFALQNVFYDAEGRRIVGLFDYNKTRLAPRLEDLKNTFLTYWPTQVYGQVYDGRVFDPMSIFDVLRGYQETVEYPLTEQELVALLDVIGNTFLLAFQGMFVFRRDRLNDPDHAKAWPVYHMGRLNYEAFLRERTRFLAALTTHGRPEGVAPDRDPINVARAKVIERFWLPKLSETQPVAEQKAAARAIGLHGDVHTSPILLDVMMDADRVPGVRRTAAEALGILGDPQAIRGLVGLIGNPETPAELVSGVALGLSRIVHAVAAANDEDAKHLLADANTISVLEAAALRNDHPTARSLLSRTLFTVTRVLGEEPSRLPELLAISPHATTVARQAAQAGADALVPFRTRVLAGESLQGDMKLDKTLATEADDAAQYAIIEAIHAAFPTHRVMSEETLPSEQAVWNDANRDSPYVWVIDPLDGTSAFVTPTSRLYSVSVALTYRGQPVVGVILAPELMPADPAEPMDRGIVFGASYHRPGAFVQFGGMNGDGEPQRLWIDPDQPLDERQALFHEVNVKTVSAVLQAHWEDIFGSLGVRAGSVALTHALLAYFNAAGDQVVLDGVPAERMREVVYASTSRGPKPWDVAAGAFILERAGGWVRVWPGLTELFPFDDAFLEQGQAGSITPYVAGVSHAVDAVVDQVTAEQASVSLPRQPGLWAQLFGGVMVLGSAAVAIFFIASGTVAVLPALALLGLAFVGVLLVGLGRAWLMHGTAKARWNRLWESSPRSLPKTIAGQLAQELAGNEAAETAGHKAFKAAAGGTLPDVISTIIEHVETWEAEQPGRRVSSWRGWKGQTRTSTREQWMVVGVAVLGAVVVAALVYLNGTEIIDLGSLQIGAQGLTRAPPVELVQSLASSSPDTIAPLASAALPITDRFYNQHGFPRHHDASEVRGSAGPSPRDMVEHAFDELVPVDGLRFMSLGAGLRVDLAVAVELGATEAVGYEQDPAVNAVANRVDADMRGDPEALALAERIRVEEREMLDASLEGAQVLYYREIGVQRQGVLAAKLRYEMPADAVLVVSRTAPDMPPLFEHALDVDIEQSNQTAILEVYRRPSTAVDMHADIDEAFRQLNTVRGMFDAESVNAMDLPRAVYEHVGVLEYLLRRDPSQIRERLSVYVSDNAQVAEHLIAWLNRQQLTGLSDIVQAQLSVLAAREMVETSQILTRDSAAARRPVAERVVSQLAEAVTAVYPEGEPTGSAVEYPALHRAVFFLKQLSLEFPDHEVERLAERVEGMLRDEVEIAQHTGEPLGSWRVFAMARGTIGRFHQVVSAFGEKVQPDELRGITQLNIETEFLLARLASQGDEVGHRYALPGLLDEIRTATGDLFTAPIALREKYWGGTDRLLEWYDLTNSQARAMLLAETERIDDEEKPLLLGEGLGLFSTDEFSVPIASSILKRDVPLYLHYLFFGREMMGDETYEEFDGYDPNSYKVLSSSPWISIQWHEDERLPWGKPETFIIYFVGEHGTFVAGFRDGVTSDEIADAARQARDGDDAPLIALLHQERFAELKGGRPTWHVDDLADDGRLLVADIGDRRMHTVGANPVTEWTRDDLGKATFVIGEVARTQRRWDPEAVDPATRRAADPSLAAAGLAVSGRHMDHEDLISGAAGQRVIAADEQVVNEPVDIRVLEGIDGAPDAARQETYDYDRSYYGFSHIYVQDGKTIRPTTYGRAHNKVAVVSGRVRVTNPATGAQRELKRGDIIGAARGIEFTIEALDGEAVVTHIYVPESDRPDLGRLAAVGVEGATTNPRAFAVWQFVALGVVAVLLWLTASAFLDLGPLDAFPDVAPAVGTDGVGQTSMISDTTPLAAAAPILIPNKDTRSFLGRPINVAMLFGVVLAHVFVPVIAFVTVPLAVLFVRPLIRSDVLPSGRVGDAIVSYLWAHSQVDFPWLRVVLESTGKMDPVQPRSTSLEKPVDPPAVLRHKARQKDPLGWRPTRPMHVNRSTLAAWVSDPQTRSQQPESPEVVITDPEGILIVATGIAENGEDYPDGKAGLAATEAEKLRSNLQKRLSETLSPLEIEQFLQRQLLEAHKRLETAGGLVMFSVAIIRQGALITANVGTGRIYLRRSTGPMQQLTIDDSYAGRGMGSRPVMDPRLDVFASLGDLSGSTLPPDAIRHHKLPVDAHVFVLSAGVPGNLSDEEITSKGRRPRKTPEQLLGAIVSAAQSRARQDTLVAKTQRHIAGAVSSARPVKGRQAREALPEAGPAEVTRVPPTQPAAPPRPAASVRVGRVAPPSTPAVAQATITVDVQGLDITADVLPDIGVVNSVGDLLVYLLNTNSQALHEYILRPEGGVAVANGVTVTRNGRDVTNQLTQMLDRRGENALVITIPAARRVTVEVVDPSGMPVAGFEDLQVDVGRPTALRQAVGQIFETHPAIRALMRQGAGDGAGWRRGVAIVFNGEKQRSALATRFDASADNTIRFQVPAIQPVTLEVVDANGRVVELGGDIGLDDGAADTVAGVLRLLLTDNHVLRQHLLEGANWRSGLQIRLNNENARGDTALSRVAVNEIRVRIPVSIAPPAPSVPTTSVVVLDANGREIPLDGTTEFPADAANTVGRALNLLLSGNARLRQLLVVNERLRPGTQISLNDARVDGGAALSSTEANRIQVRVDVRVPERAAEAVPQAAARAGLRLGDVVTEEQIIVLDFLFNVLQGQTQIPNDPIDGYMLVLMGVLRNVGSEERDGVQEVFERLHATAVENYPSLAQASTAHPYVTAMLLTWWQEIGAELRPQGPNELLSAYLVEVFDRQLRGDNAPFVQSVDGAEWTATVVPQLEEEGPARAVLQRSPQALTATVETYGQILTSLEQGFPGQRASANPNYRYRAVLLSTAIQNALVERFGPQFRRIRASVGLFGFGPPAGTPPDLVDAVRELNDANSALGRFIGRRLRRMLGDASGDFSTWIGTQNVGNLATWMALGVVAAVGVDAFAPVLLEALAEYSAISEEGIRGAAAVMAWGRIQEVMPKVRRLEGDILLRGPQTFAHDEPNPLHEIQQLVGEGRRARELTTSVVTQDQLWSGNVVIIEGELVIDGAELRTPTVAVVTAANPQGVTIVVLTGPFEVRGYHFAPTLPSTPTSYQFRRVAQTALGVITEEAHRFVDGPINFATPAATLTLIGRAARAYEQRLGRTAADTHADIVAPAIEALGDGLAVFTDWARGEGHLPLLVGALEATAPAPAPGLGVVAQRSRAVKSTLAGLEIEPRPASTAPDAEERAGGSSGGAAIGVGPGRGQRIVPPLPPLPLAAADVNMKASPQGTLYSVRLDGDLVLRSDSNFAAVVHEAKARALLEARGWTGQASGQTAPGAGTTMIVLYDVPNLFANHYGPASQLIEYWQRLGYEVVVAEQLGVAQVLSTYLDLPAGSEVSPVSEADLEALEDAGRFIARLDPRELPPGEVLDFAAVEAQIRRALADDGIFRQPHMNIERFLDGLPARQRMLLSGV